ncbi:unnamed protein product [Closterium sp. Naga37s-1]|nr:unnamed protein product [Closterium sp. Naga37s-1]
MERGPRPARPILSREPSRRQQRSRKVPEPLRRAIAECTQPHAAPLETAACHPVRTLEVRRARGGGGLGGGNGGKGGSGEGLRRDYLGDAATVDMAYNALLDHAMVEKGRSPHVIMKVVALLKKYLFRYGPAISTLEHIDGFCADVIAELKAAQAARHRLGNAAAAAAGADGPTAESGPALIKSLLYVRAVVARNLPAHLMRSARAADGGMTAGGAGGGGLGVGGAAGVGGPRTPSRVAPLAVDGGGAVGVGGGASAALKRASAADREAAQATAMAMARLIPGQEGGVAAGQYAPMDMLRVRWISRSRGWAPSAIASYVAYPPPRAPSDLPHLEPLRTVADGSAAAVLLGVHVVQLEAEGSPDLLHFDTVTGTVDPVLVRNHIRHITITKRLKADPTGAAGDGLQSSMKRRRPLFQYRYYSEQQPLRLSEGEMEEVMAAVCSVAATAAAGGAGGAGAHGSARLSSPAHHMVPQVDAADVAASVLIKMLIDMYLVDPRSAAPLALSMMHTLLSSNKPTVRMRAFDLMLNLGVHAHLLHPLPVEDEAGQPYSSDADAAEAERGAVRRAAAVTMFEEWLLGLLCDMALYLVQVEESDESVWAAALSCLLYLTCDRGRTVFHRLALLDVRVLALLLEISIVHGWAQAVHTHLVRMLACLLYAAPHHTAQHPPGRAFEAARDGLRLDVKQLERVGGISFICCHYAASQEVEARRNLFAVVMDYVALLCRLHPHPHHPNHPPPSEVELAAVVAALVAAGAPEALAVALKAPSPPAGPIGAALARTIAASLPPDPSAAGFSLQVRIRGRREEGGSTEGRRGRRGAQRGAGGCRRAQEGVGEGRGTRGRHWGGRAGEGEDVGGRTWGGGGGCGVTDTLDDLISAHLRLPPEFTAMLQCTLASDGPPPDPAPSTNTRDSAGTSSNGGAGGGGADEAEVGKERRAWGTLRALLHSQRAVDRRNGLTWLLHLLLQQLPNLAPYQQPLLADPQDGQQQQQQRGRGGQLMVLYRQLAQLEQGEAGEEGGGGGGMGMGMGGGAGGGGGGGGGRRAGVSGAVQLMLELVRSDNTAVRRGFVTVLEQLLLLHAAETEQESRESRGAAHAAAAAAAEAPEGPMGMEERRAADEAAAAASAVQHQGAQDLLAVMSSALWQVMSCNDSDRVNILQMCSVMLWQLCVPRFLPTAQVVEPGSPVPSPGGSSWLVNPRVAAVAGGEGGVAMSPPYAAEESESMARLFLLRRAAAARELLAALPTALLYWPLMQLAPSAGDPIALATAVGSHGIVGAGGAVDVRVALLLLLIGKCSDSSEALEEVGGDAFFRSLLDDPDARIAYWSAAFLVKRMMSQQPDVYRRALHRLIFTAQQTNNEKLLENPYLQMRGILQDTPDALHLTS